MGNMRKAPPEGGAFVKMVYWFQFTTVVAGAPQGAPEIEPVGFWILMLARPVQSRKA